MQRSLLPILLLLFITLINSCAEKQYVQKVPFKPIDARFVKAKNIASVRNVTDQFCSSFGSGTGSVGSEDSEKIQKSGVVSLDDLGLDFIIPQFEFPDSKSNYYHTHISILRNDKSRGIVDNYIWISDQSLKLPFAAIVVSELPKKFQNTEILFDNLKGHNRLQVSGKDIYSIERVFEGSYGPTFELIVKNRAGSPCFPTSTYNMLPKGYKISTLAISRFIVINKKQIEFVLITVIPKLYSMNKAIDSARDQMDIFMSSLKMVSNPD